MFRSSFIKRMVVFTEQSPVLRQVSKTLSLPSNIWLEDWVVSQKKDLKLTVPEGMHPTKVSIWKYFEVYNTDQLVDKTTKVPFPPSEVQSAGEHVSYSSKKPYGKNLAKEMESVRMERGYSSMWWVSTSRTYGAKPEFETRDENQRPHKFFTISQVSLFPLAKLQGESKEFCMTQPILGSTRRYMVKSPQATALINEAKGMGCKANLFFTDRQLVKAGIAVKPNQRAIDVTFSSNKSAGGDKVLYNIEQVESWQNILSEIGRYGSPDHPVYLFSGLDVTSEGVLKCQEERKFKQGYWLTLRDIESNSWKIKESEKEKGISVYSEGLNHYLNVEQLVNPEEGFCRAGLLELHPIQ